MKILLLAMPTLGTCAGAAYVQTAITVDGSFDAGVRNLSHADRTNFYADIVNSKTSGSAIKLQANQTSQTGMEII